MTRLSEAELNTILHRNADLHAEGVKVASRPEPPLAKAKRLSYSAAPTEAQEQRAVMQWAAWNQGQHPELALLAHIPNEGNRGEVGQAIAVSLGLRPGFPDLALPVARGKYHGLFIELKRADGSNKPTPEQVWWLDRLSDEGNRTEVCYGADEAIAVIEEYLGMKG